MYIEARLNQLLCSSDIDSPDYILASYFLNEAITQTKLTLQAIQNSTYISISTINRFIKTGGFSSLKEFQRTLRDEKNAWDASRSGYREITVDELNDYSRSLTELSGRIRQAAGIISSCKRVFVYGNYYSIIYFIPFFKDLQRRGISYFILNDWKFSSIEKKILSMTEEDCFLFIEPEMPLSSIMLRSELMPGVVSCSAISRCAGNKIYICRDSESALDNITIISLSGYNNDELPHYIIHSVSEMMRAALT